MTIKEMNFSPNGYFHCMIKSPDGYDIWDKFQFQSMSPFEEIIFINAFSDANKNTVRASFNEL